jgi:hypothetical protein
MSDKEIVKALRKRIRIRTIADRGGTNLLILAADMFEQQAAEIERLTQERDEAVLCEECVSRKDGLCYDTSSPCQGYTCDWAIGCFYGKRRGAGKE